MSLEKLFDNTNTGLLECSYEILKNIKRYGRPIFLCVGSDKFVMDSLAPMVGEILKKEYNINAYVYGGLDYNINAENLSQAVNYIETIHANSFVVLIDATLGESLGKVKITSGSFAGLGRQLPIRKIGTISILGIVGKKSRDFNLNSTRLKVVVDMSRFIAKACYLAVTKYDGEVTCVRQNLQNF